MSTLQQKLQLEFLRKKILKILIEEVAVLQLLYVSVLLAWSAGSLTKDNRAMWITNLPVLRLVNTCTAL